MKKITALILIAVMLICMCSCTSKEKEDDGKYLIGIAQYAPHIALDAATKGFKDAVIAGLGEENVEFIEKNASGELPNCTSIATTLVASKPDLIMANATPILQAIVSATDKIPVLGTSVTHYAPALGIEKDDWKGTTGKNISGTSDLAPLDQQAAMIKEWFPDCKKVAILYCSSEANSIFQAEEVAEHLAKLNIESKDFTFEDSSTLSSVTLSACKYADVIYVPTDNTAANYTGTIYDVVLPEKTPVIAGEKGICEGCGVATLSIDYYELGVATGKMAVEILKNGKNISEMPIELAPEFTKLYSIENCKAFGITPVEGYEGFTKSNSAN